MASLSRQEQTVLRELSRLAGSDRIVTGRELRDARFAEFVADTYGADVAYPQSLQSRKLQILRDKGYIRMERHDGGTYTPSLQSRPPSRPLHMKAFIMHVGHRNKIDIEDTIKRRRTFKELEGKLPSNAPAVPR